MTHAVLQGKPTAAQLYLDGLLNEVLASRGKIPDAEGRERVSLPQILFHCLAKNLEGVFMIHGVTGEKITNVQILKQAIPLARKLESEGIRGKVVMVAMASDHTMVAVYLALLFAGVVPLFTNANSTIYELSYYLKEIEPWLVFCDERYYEDLKTALKGLPQLGPDVVLVSALPESISDMDVLTFQIPDACVDDMVLLVPTSGSTGLPKACILTHRGFVTKLPAAWYRSTRFPKPTGQAMVLSDPAGILFHRMVTSCIAFNVPVLLPCEDFKKEWVKTALLTYRPTWAHFASEFAKSLLTIITADHLSSLQCLKLGGARPCNKTKANLMDLLPKSAVLEETYGMTETHSMVAGGENGEPLRMTNMFEYKLIDADGKTLGLCATGELCLRGPALAKGYYNRNNREFLEDGWYKTGDLFYVNEEEKLFYQMRASTCFKYLNFLLSPEEVEAVINSIPGVLACVVCHTEQGPSAAVVARGVTRDRVHKTVNDALCFFKRLHGGVGFVPSLPVLHSGKLDRAKSCQLVQHLVTTGECY